MISPSQVDEVVELQPLIDTTSDAIEDALNPGGGQLPIGPACWPDILAASAGGNLGLMEPDAVEADDDARSSWHGVAAL